jgi:hypothetical protein
MPRHRSANRSRRRAHLGLVASTAVLCAALCAAGPASAASAWTVGATTRTGEAQAQALAAPGNVTATCTNPTSARTITVTWTSVPHATYTIYQSTTSATSGFSVTASGVSGTSWTSGTLTSGRTYWYEVAAVLSTNWQSSPSAATTGRKINLLSPYCQ